MRPWVRSVSVALLLLAIHVTNAPSARADELTVLYQLPLQPSLTRLAEQFTKDTGHTVVFTIPTGAELTALLAGAGPADILIGTPAQVDKAIADNTVTRGKTPIGRVGISAVVRRGTPVPDISTLDGLKKAVLAADSVVFNGAGSGQYVLKVLTDLGVAEDIKAKVARPANGPATMDHVIKSTGNEIAFGLTPEAYPYSDKGVQTIGPLPAAVQTYTIYEAAVLTRSPSPAVAARFIAFITSPGARKTLAETGVVE